MAELSIRIKQLPKSLCLLKWLKIATYSINTFVFFLMCWLAYRFTLFSSPTKVNKEQFDDFFRRLGWIAGALYTMLSFSIIVTYIYLLKALKKQLSYSQMQEISRNLTCLFLVLVFSYTIRTVILIGQGEWHFIVKQKYIRLEFEFVAWPVLDFMAIIPNLVMHKRNFSENKPTTT